MSILYPCNRNFTTFIFKVYEMYLKLRFLVVQKLCPQKYPLLQTSTIPLPRIPYSGKVWWVESLANLANCLQFAKLKPSKVVPTINNPSMIYSFAKLFSAKHLKRANSPNILPAKLSHYMIFHIHSLTSTTIIVTKLARPDTGITDKTETHV